MVGCDRGEDVAESPAKLGDPPPLVDNLPVSSTRPRRFGPAGIPKVTRPSCRKIESPYALLLENSQCTASEFFQSYF